MGRYWPGPSPSCCPAGPTSNADLGEDDATIGIRCPAHPVPLAVCRQIGPLATTSANRHGERRRLRPPQDVSEALGAELVLVLDAGPCDGLPSTVVDCTGEAPRLLREGRPAPTARDHGGRRSEPDQRATWPRFSPRWR